VVWSAGRFAAKIPIGDRSRVDGIRERLEVCARKQTWQHMRYETTMPLSETSYFRP
jgi:hypothetical protein